MDEWLGIEHLFELSASEAIWGFLTPLFVFIAFFVVQLILPGRRVPGYVVDSETGEPRSYRLNGILVFAVAMIVWAFEIGGLPRDWFYRSSAYAVAGGTVLTIIMTSIAVFTQPEGKVKNPFLAVVVRAGPGDSVLQRAFRREDVFLCRRRDDALAELSVRCGVALSRVR